jgi:hypothetical protein
LSTQIASGSAATAIGYGDSSPGRPADGTRAITWPLRGSICKMLADGPLIAHNAFVPTATELTRSRSW